MLHLQEIHKQSAGASVAISPGMYRNKFEVSPEAEVVYGTYIGAVKRLATIIQFSAEGIKPLWHFQLTHI